MYNILVFDVYNVFYRVFFGNETLTKIDGKLIPIDAICKFFELCDNYIDKYGIKKDCKIYWLMDNAKTTILKNRKLMDENYKKDRKEMPQEFYDALNIIELILKFYRDGILYRKQGVEADDYICNLVDNYIKEHDHVLLFTTDIDWCRCLMNDIQNDIIINQYTKNKEILTVKSFEDKFGFKPTETNVCFWKTFYGDKSDNILPTLANLPKSYFLDILKKYSHVDLFINDALNGKIKYLDKGWLIRIKQLEQRIRLNWNLISSAEISTTDMEQWKVECAYKPNKLLIIYSTLNILGRFDKRIKQYDKKDSIWNMLNGETLDRANE